MQQINIGDFILGKDGLWEIIDIRQSGVDTVYDLKALAQPADFLELFDHSTEEWEKHKVHKDMMGVSRGYLRHLGEIVSKDSEKAIKTLFGD
jgi:hypothetical protein